MNSDGHLTAVEYSAALGLHHDEPKSEPCSENELQVLECVDSGFYPHQPPQQYYPDPYQEYVFNCYDQDQWAAARSGFHGGEYHHHLEARAGLNEDFRNSEGEYFDLERNSEIPYPSESSSSFETNPYVDPVLAQRSEPTPGGYPEPVDSICTGNSGVCSNSCTICGRFYARSSTLKTHLRVHSGERPYACLQCLKRFSQAANLTAHMRIHSGEKPFLCPICHRKFSQSSSVTTHMRTHSGERPYVCSLCKKSFSDSSTLTKHFRTHSGERPYQCRICFMRFSQSGNLNRHMKIHGQKNS